MHGYFGGYALVGLLGVVGVGFVVVGLGVNRLLRNCLIAAGNSGDQSLLPSIRAHLDHDDEVVAEAAAWALGELQEA